MEEAGNVLEVEAMEKLYEELESNGIEVIDDTPVEVDDTVAAPDDGADGDDAVILTGSRQLLAGEGHFKRAGNTDDGQVFFRSAMTDQIVHRAADEPVHNEIVETCRKDGEFEIRRVEMPVDGLDLVHGSLVCMG